MKLARLYYKYIYTFKRRSSDVGWTGLGNLGDNVQTLAVMNIYRSIRADSPQEIIPINRDELKSYCGEDVVLLMQGWFGKPYGSFEWPPANAVHPVFAGFHLATGENTRRPFEEQGGIEYCKRFAPIGCRDLSTRDYLLSRGVDAYFSGCHTLTFPQRESEPAEGKVYIVDVEPSWMKKIPQSLRSDAVIVSQGFYFGTYPPTDEEAIAVEQEAVELLDEYRRCARMVITSRIHCAMPCLAMGIPVIFLASGSDKDARYSVLQHFIPTYTLDDIGEINWSPQPVFFESLKRAMIQNAVERLEAELTGNKLSPERSQELIDNITSEFAARETFFPRPKPQPHDVANRCIKRSDSLLLEAERNKSLTKLCRKAQLAALRKEYLRCKLLRVMLASVPAKRRHYQYKAKLVKALIRRMSQ